MSSCRATNANQRDLTDRIAALDVIEPPPGWVERATDRFRRETMHTTYDLHALPLPTVPPSRSDTEHSLRIAALLTHLGITGQARADILQLVEAHGDAMVRREVLRAGDEQITATKGR